MAGRAVAAIGVVLAFVGIWIEALAGVSYWDLDGTFAAFVIVVTALAALGLAAGYVGRAMDGTTFGLGAVLLGFNGWFPAATAFSDWDQTRAGLWLCFVGAALVVIGAGTALLAAGDARDTPAGLSGASLTAAVGIALLFPAIFVAAEQGTSYWNGPLGHSLGIVMLIGTVAAALAWAAAMSGIGVRGLDAGLMLVLLGLFAVNPVGAAFGDFGNLDAGSWLGLAGGVLAAGGVWVARGTEMPDRAAAAA